MRALLTNHGFTISVFVSVAITAMFAIMFEASQELVASLLVLGRGGRTRLSFEFGAPAVTAIPARIGSESDGTDR